MRTICLVIAYDGAAYSGWQIQPRDLTVQGEVERCLHEMTKHPCRLRAAGRTDAGVHALGQVASFHTAATIPLHGFLRGLNTLLPADIAIVRVEEAPADFDARRHNHGKHYRYAIWNQRSPEPLVLSHALHVFPRLDLLAMVRAAGLLVGTHDFAAFRSASCERESTVRTLYRCTIARQGNLITLDVEGTAFLKNMVRIIAGTLIEVGRGQRQPESVTALLAGGDRRLAGFTAPARGLTLVRVFLQSPPYPECYIPPVLPGTPGASP